MQQSSIFRRIFGLVLVPFVAALIAACSAPLPVADAIPPGMAFLSHGEEQIYSEILQAKQRIVMRIELVDTARPKNSATIDGARGFIVPVGNRRVQFHVVLPSTGLMDSRAREARGYFDVTLVEGHRYRVAGEYRGNLRTFRLVDLTTGEAASPAIDLGFFGPVRREMEFIPIIIPIKT